LRSTVSFHRFAQKLQGSLAIPPLGDDRLQHFAFVIDRLPEVVLFAIDTHENFVEMPTFDPNATIMTI
jgi:hypothetical protein